MHLSRLLTTPSSGPCQLSSGRWRPLSFTCDHLIPLSRRGDLLDSANARSVHRACNGGRGNCMRPSAPHRASRSW
ncbi:HNH endonuclease [Streptomyces sp. NPDC053431]|uniref:HNH endonuclease n=1 Tax=Streptomyces sp. NPDC053431 TaxID=3365703 RepID=UPI0037D8EDA7